MKNKIKNIALINTIANLILQLTTIVSGFIIPKVILINFGSEVNGLVSSLNQFLNYINLLEGGIIGVIMANLYKPLYEKDYEKLSAVVKTSEIFFKKIAKIYIVYSIVLAIVYPFLINKSFSYIYVFSLTLILSVNLFMQYCFSLNLKVLLDADKKIYITATIQTVLMIINIFLALISIKIYPSIHILKIATAIGYFILPIIYKYFINKYYKLDENATIDKNLLKSRWDGFAINIAYFIHSNTDIAVLTLLEDLKVVSVYGIYKLVTTGVNQMINSVASAISPSIGHLYASRR